MLSTRWSATEEYYGVLPALWGTLYTSGIAILIAFPLSIGIVAFTYEYAPQQVRDFLQSLTFYSASIPTVLYGLWGLEFITPMIRVVSALLNLPGASPTGQSIMSAGIVLALMNLPYITLIVGEAYRAIPFTYIEALHSLGAYGFDRFWVNFRMIGGAVLGALLLAFGKCIGETTAVSMVVGNSFNLAISPFEPGVTVSSVIVNYISEAALYRYMFSALYAAAFVMLVINTLFILLGLRLVERVRKVTSVGL